MPTIRMRPKHQVTLPASVVRQANLALDDKLEVTYSHGVIVLTPQAKASAPQNFDPMAYAGIGKGIWGATAKEINQHLDELRG